MKRKKTYPCYFPIILKDGIVIRCWYCNNCKKYTKYLETKIKKDKKSRRFFKYYENTSNN